MTIILIIIAVIILSGFISYLIYRKLKPLIQQARELDLAIEEKNKELLLQSEQLLLQSEQLNNEIVAYNCLKIQKDEILNQIGDLEKSFENMKKTAENAAQSFAELQMQLAKEQVEKQQLNYSENLKQFKENCDNEIFQLTQQKQQYEQEILWLKNVTEAAIAAAKRAEEMKEQQNFYRIQISQEDIEEIELLRQVSHRLRNQEPLNKIIWKCYYERPTTDMIGRVVGLGVHIGIYKITEISTGKCYIGQSNNIMERFKQHIKRGIGAEAPTRNKLYPAMSSAGPENFTFEVIEECERERLDEREKYWTDYFKAQEFGFSIRKG